MITPKKEKSGRWRVRIYAYTDESGKHYKSITADTKAECIRKATLYKAENGGKKPDADKDIKVIEAIDRYIELSQTLSPTTLHAYDRIKEFAFPSIMHRKVNGLDDVAMQSAINMEMKRPAERTGKPLSAKTVKNEWGLVAAALRTICKKQYDIRLPKVQRNHADLPEPSAVMSAVKGTTVELPTLMAMWLSFSMSEIRGIRCSDIKNGFIRISQVTVTVGTEDVTKSDAKTETRKRVQKIPAYIMQLIEESENYKIWKKEKKDRLLVPYSRDKIYHAFQREMAKSGITISFHDLRHIYASVMLTKLSAPSKVVQDGGGWKSDYVMKTVYSNMFDDTRSEWADKRDAYFMEQMQCNTTSMTEKYDESIQNT